MKKFEIVIFIILLSGCASLPLSPLSKNNNVKIHRKSGEKPSWTTTTKETSVVEIDGEKYFLVTAEGKNLEYLQRVSLDAKATEETLNFYGAEKLKFYGMVRIKSYWEQYETINQDGIYEYHYKVWGLYSIPKP